MGLLKHWRFLLLTLVAMTALVGSAACGDDDDEGDDGGSPTATTADETPAGDGRQQGGDVIVQGTEFASLDAHFSSFAQDISLMRMIWRGLYTLDKNNEPQPAMAASAPDISADGKTVTVTLKDGLKWSDGDPLTAEDFRAGILRTCNPTIAGEYQYILTNIVGCDAHYGNEAGFDQALEDAIGVKAVDDTTIEFSLQESGPTFPTILTMWMTFPVPVHLFPTSSAEWPAGEDAPGKLAYNGPYILTEYKTQDHVTLEPNPNWAAPAGVSPTLDSITIKFIDDLAVAANAYRNDELQATDVDLTQLEQLKGEFGENDQYFKFLAASTRGLQFQHNKPPLDKFEVRLALSRAIDREQLVIVATQGGNAATTSWIPETVPGGAATDAFEDVIGFDPAAAAKALSDAGYPDGAGFPKLTILVGDSPTAKSVAEFLQQSFKTHLKIDVDIEVVDGQTRSKRYTAKQFELFHGGWVQDYPDPENWVIGLYDTGGSLNNGECSDADIDALIEDAKFNPDYAERIDQYTEINNLIVEHLCNIAPYWHEYNHWLVNDTLTGLAENQTVQDAAMAGDWAAEAWGLKE